MRFRPLTDDDLPMLHAWLNEPGVVAWWEGEDVSWEAVRREYAEGADPRVEHWVAVDDSGDVGWIQCYPIAPFLDDEEDGDEARAWVKHGVPTTAAGIDYLIGAPDARGRGLGSRMIAAFVEDVLAVRHPGWDPVCASPYTANAASWRALARAGFAHTATFHDEDGSCTLMVRHRAAPRPHLLDDAPGGS